MSASDPVVSVVLPTYNRADILEAAVRSVLDQTYEQFELLVVDDASDDDTRAVVKALDDGRIEYHSHDENRGAPAARNTGIEAARGEIIAFQDSDDEWRPEKLAKQVARHRETPPEVGMVYTGIQRREQGEWRYLPYPDVEQTTGDVRRSLARQNFIPTPVASVRADCLDAVGGFDEEAWPLSDWELWIRLSEQVRFDLVDEPLVTSEVRADSISRNRRAKVEARRHIVTKHADFFDRSALSRQLFYVGHGYMKLGETREGRAYLGRSVRTRPEPLSVGALLLSALGGGAYARLFQRYKESGLSRAAPAGDGVAPSSER